MPGYHQDVTHSETAIALPEWTSALASKLGQVSHLADGCSSDEARAEPANDGAGTSGEFVGRIAGQDDGAERVSGAEARAFGAQDDAVTGDEPSRGTPSDRG